MGHVDTILQHSYRSTFAQVTECYFTAPSRHLNKYWLFIRKVIWQSSDGNFTASAQTTILYNDFEKYTCNYCQCIYIHTGSLQNQHFDYGMDKQWHSQEEWIVLTQRCPDSRGGLTEPSLWLCNGHHGKLNGPIARYVKLRVAHAPGILGTFFPPPRVCNPDMHHGTCVTHVPWCMPGSLTSSCLWSRWRGKRSRHSWRMPTRNFTFMARGQCRDLN